MFRYRTYQSRPIPAGGRIADVNTPVLGQSAAADVTAPTVVSFSPIDGATDVAITSDLVITFSENIQAGSGSIDLYRTLDDALIESFTVGTAAVVISGTTATMNPTSDLSNSEDYYVQVDNGAITDLSSNVYTGFIDETTWNFTTIMATDKTIYRVQSYDTIYVAS